MNAGRCLFVVREAGALDYQRIIWPARALAKAGRAAVRLAAEPNPTHIRGTDVAMLRGHADREAYEFICQAQVAGVRVILDVASWLDAPPYDPRFTELASRRPYSELALATADVVTTATPELAEELATCTTRAVALPTRTSSTRVNQASRAELRKRFGVPSDAVVLAWPGRETDLHSLNMVARATERLLCERTDLWFMFFSEIGSVMYVPEDRRISLGPLPYLQYLEALDATDVVVVPLEPTLYNTVRGLSAEHDILLKRTLCGVVSQVGSAEMTDPARILRVEPGDDVAWVAALEELADGVRDGSGSRVGDTSAGSQLSFDSALLSILCDQPELAGEPRD